MVPGVCRGARLCRYQSRRTQIRAQGHSIAPVLHEDQGHADTRNQSTRVVEA